MALTLIIAGVAYLASCYLEHSFAKEMQDFIEGPKYVDKATNTEDVKKLEQEETEVGDLIDLSGNCEMNYKVEPSAPPYDEPKQLGLYPDLSEELLALLFNKKDSQPSSNFNSALPPSNTARDVIQS
ncbi:hypothetical protein [Wolbachia endosymbiont (group A) of Myopa testacea]|uniref:hypothetical protein n=1 Tax=Wolbachia endosymbiont (group A) of Myopa testacea TaxID=3066148 RepID=UPI003133415D